MTYGKVLFDKSISLLVLIVDLKKMVTMMMSFSSDTNKGIVLVSKPLDIVLLS